MVGSVGGIGGGQLQFTFILQAEALHTLGARARGHAFAQVGLGWLGHTPGARTRPGCGLNQARMLAKDTRLRREWGGVGRAMLGVGAGEDVRASRLGWGGLNTHWDV